MKAILGSDLDQAGEIIRNGGLVAFPTETVYGLGANALDPAAVAGIFDAKGRPRFDPLIVHVRAIEELESLVSAFPPVAQQLASRFWPGPLTLVLPKTERVPDLVTSGLPTVAVRIPRHPIARRLLEIAGVPIAAPSANRFGRLSPTRAGHVAEQLGEQIDYILDGGNCEVGVESTVLDLTTLVPKLLRPGGISLEELREAIGQIDVIDSTNQTDAPSSPGMLTKHYAPQTRVIAVDTLNNLPIERGRCALLSFGPMSAETTRGFSIVETLSEKQDLKEAAAKFFATLRKLDDANVECIIALRFPDEGLGRALNDRLQRAAKSGEPDTE